MRALLIAVRARAASRRAAIDSSIAVLSVARLGVLGVERQRLIDFAQRHHEVLAVVVGGVETLRRTANQLLDLSSEAFGRLGGGLPCERLLELVGELGGARVLRHQFGRELQVGRGGGEITRRQMRGGLVDPLLAFAPARFGGLSAARAAVA